MDELIKLKYVTGFAKLFDGAMYSDSWESNNQIMGRKKYEAETAAATSKEETKE